VSQYSKQSMSRDPMATRSSIQGTVAGAAKSTPKVQRPPQRRILEHEEEERPGDNNSFDIPEAPEETPLNPVRRISNERVMATNHGEGIG